MSLQGVSFGKGRKSEPRLSAPYVPGKKHERFWTESELQVLRDHYPSKGMNFCLAKLPGRTKSGAHGMAHKLGLHFDGVSAVRNNWRDRFPEIDAALREAWPSLAEGRGGVKKLAQRLGVPRDVLNRRSIVLGLAMPRIKEAPWTAAEEAMLQRVPLHNLRKAAEIFASHGFPRSEAAIMVRCKRLDIKRRYTETLSATGAAKILGVDGKTFTTWIEKGWIAAGRRGTRRLAQQGGDAHTIERRVLRQYILDNLEIIDIRKVDKFAFVDLLLDPSAGAGTTGEHISASVASSRPDRRMRRSSRRKEAA